MKSASILWAILNPWGEIRRQYRIIEQLKGKTAALEDILSNPRLVGIKAADDQLSIGLEGPMTTFITAVMEGLVVGCEAENYLEMSLRSPERGRFAVVVTRPGGGLSPHQLRLAAEQERDRLRERLAEIEGVQP
jgi:hypothetical protein